MEDLTRKHLRTVNHYYQRNFIEVRSMQHIKKLRSLYDSALGAKRAYHSLLAGMRFAISEPTV